MVVNKKSDRMLQLFLNLFFVLFSLLFVLPLMSIVVISLTDEVSIVKDGYPFFFREIDWSSYQKVMEAPEVMINAYKTTIIVTAVGTITYLIIASLAAYVISRPNYRFRRGVTFFFFFTMIFSGGTVPSYLVMTQVLNLKNTYMAMILPGLAGCWNLMMLKTFMKGVPNEIIEAATIDGAGPFATYRRIMLPLCKPALATIGLLLCLSYWNSWESAMLYITDTNMYPLQYVLQNMLRNMFEVLKRMMEGKMVANEVVNLPSEGMRMAMCVVAVGPMLCVFPFFQKYFTKGLTVGSVKG